MQNIKEFAVRADLANRLEVSDTSLDNITHENAEQEDVLVLTS